MNIFLNVDVSTRPVSTWITFICIIYYVQFFLKWKKLSMYFVIFCRCWRLVLKIVDTDSMSFLLRRNFLMKLLKYWVQRWEFILMVLYTQLFIAYNISWVLCSCCDFKSIQLEYFILLSLQLVTLNVLPVHMDMKE